MRSRSLLVLFLACALASLSAQSAVSKKEVEIGKLNDEEVQAFVKNDVPAMDRLWAESFVVTNPLNKFIDKKQLMEMVRSGFLAIPTFERRIEYVRFYGDVAVVVGEESVVWGGRMPNAGKTQKLRFTGIWQKQGRVWRQVARHANIVPEAK